MLQVRGSLEERTEQYGKTMADVAKHMGKLSGASSLIINLQTDSNE